ncbi:hypothetical protein LCGC14_1714650 [marine sediment metagenome]|uniref:N-acetyltransferase domain-containing protein n=1 Tax=marine sediment metagenome TaxID=412755 RepID=A0A0F9HEQ9_9ZZZZ
MDIKLRLVRKEDYPLTMAWRSNPDLYQGFYRQDAPLTWEDHIAWHNSRNKDWRNFLAIYDGRTVGVVTIGQLDHWEPEVGIYVGEATLWGKGIGTKMMQKGIEWIQEYSLSHNHIQSVHTTILDSNLASIKLFEKCGFKRVSVARESESWYVRPLRLEGE